MGDGLMALDPEMCAWVNTQIEASEARVARVIADARRIDTPAAGLGTQQATVVGVVGRQVQVQLDVDGEVVSMVSTASVVVGDRVAVLVTPPAGSLVLGKIA